MRQSLILKTDLKQSIKIQVLLTTLISFVFANLIPLPAANAAANPLEILSVTELSDTSVEILFNSKISKNKIKNYVITAAFDPLATNTSESVILNSSNLVGSSTKKVLKVKSTGLISTKVNNLTPKAPYIFTVSAKMNQGKLITSEPTNYLPLSNVMDAVANLPADWGNPKPISAPLAAPAFTLSSSSETRTVNTAATGFTVSSTGGAIASFAINATPPGMSFNTSTGALTGTPNTIAAATNYTITATNASGSATQTFTLTVTVAAPAFTLSSASESKTVNTAITGYSISSTGGAIASYAISPAAPAGLTFNTSTGLLSGTPTTVAGATSYTITATNASGSATRTFTLTVTAVVYTVGQTGPGGGIIYFVSSEGFSCGPTLAATCNYLEVAPSGWNTGADPDIRWAVPAQQSSDVTSITNDAVPYNNVLGIGVGYRNSVAIVNEGNDTTTAAGLARAYAGGGKNDWYLPSTAELNLLCQWVRGVTTSVTTVCSGGYYEQNGTGNLVAAGIKNNYYWSSSEKNASYAWYQDLYYYLNAPQSTFFSKNYAGSVRPVRAF